MKPSIVAAGAIALAACGASDEPAVVTPTTAGSPAAAAPGLPAPAPGGFVQSATIAKSELFLDGSPIAARTGEYFAFPVYTQRIRHTSGGTPYRTELFEVVRVYRRLQERDGRTFDVRVTTREDAAGGRRVAGGEALYRSGQEVQFVDLETGRPLVGYLAIRDAFWDRGHRVQVELAMPGRIAEPVTLPIRSSAVTELTSAAAVWAAARRGDVITLSARYCDDATDLGARFAAVVPHAAVVAAADGSRTVWIELDNREYWGPRGVIDIGRFEIRPTAAGGYDARVESYVEDARTGEVIENHSVRLRLGDTLRLFARSSAPRGRLRPAAPG
jgi:hypothetical protein